jgi:hypothetical protein
MENGKRKTENKGEFWSALTVLMQCNNEVISGKE